LLVLHRGRFTLIEHEHKKVCHLSRALRPRHAFTLDNVARLAPAGCIHEGDSEAIDIDLLRNQVTRCSGDLRHVAGVGAARAAQILAAVELGRRTLVRGAVDRPRLSSPRQLAAHLLPQYGAGAVEQFGIVMLDTKHRVIRVKIISTGSLDATVVHPREVFREAAAASAAAIVLFHNHPSGDPTPSPDDVVLTTRMVSAGDIMGIEVVDHLILADQRYYSLIESGRLPRRV
jgi:DNA repair protein RadC